MDEPEERSLLDIEKLSAQLKEERRLHAAEVAGLKAQIRTEQIMNQFEWDQFFRDADLKDTFTGKPIRSRADFAEWKQRFEAAKAARSRNPSAEKPQETYFYLEAADGSLVRVPESKLEAWQKAQDEGPRPLTEREKELIKRAANRIHHDGTAAPAPSPAKPDPPPPADRRSHRLKSVFLGKVDFVICLLFSVAFVVLLCVGIFTQDSPASSDGDAPAGVSAPAENDDPWSSPYVADHVTDYVGSVDSDLVHKSDCRYAANINEENRVYYEKLVDAANDGRRRCSVCLPGDTAASSGFSSPPAGVLIRPATGRVFRTPLGDRVAPLTIKTSGTDDYFVSLALVGSSTSAMTFYVRGGDTADVKVPLGEYEIYYATGSGWQGEEDLFGEETSYCKCDDTFRFYLDGSNYYQGWTLTLYAVSNGNMDTEHITAAGFPS